MRGRKGCPVKTRRDFLRNSAALPALAGLPALSLAVQGDSTVSPKFREAMHRVLDFMLSDQGEPAAAFLVLLAFNYMRHDLPTPSAIDNDLAIVGKDCLRELGAECSVCKTGGVDGHPRKMMYCVSCGDIDEAHSRAEDRFKELEERNDPALEWIRPFYGPAEKFAGIFSKKRHLGLAGFKATGRYNPVGERLLRKHGCWPFA